MQNESIFVMKKEIIHETKKNGKKNEKKSKESWSLSLPEIPTSTESSSSSNKELDAVIHSWSSSSFCLISPRWVQASSYLVGPISTSWSMRQ